MPANRGWGLNGQLFFSCSFWQFRGHAIKRATEESAITLYDGTEKFSPKGDLKLTAPFGGKLIRFRGLPDEGDPLLIGNPFKFPIVLTHAPFACAESQGQQVFLALVLSLEPLEGERYRGVFPPLFFLGYYAEELVSPVRDFGGVPPNLHKCHILYGFVRPTNRDGRLPVQRVLRNDAHRFAVQKH